MNANAFLDQIKAAISGKPDVVPKGFKTAVQWAKEWGMSPSTAARTLSKGVRAGLVKVLKLRAETGRGIFPVPHYGLA